MQTTTSPQERIAFWKDAKRQLTQHHVDIDRLWRAADDYTSQGIPLQGNGTITFTTSSTSSTTTSNCAYCDAACFSTTFPVDITGGGPKCSGYVDLILRKRSAGCSWSIDSFTGLNPGVASALLQILSADEWRFDITASCSGGGGVSAQYRRTITPGDCNTITLDFFSGDSIATWPSTVVFTKTACP